MTKIYSHRGAAGTARENTVEAFAEARALGAAGVEFDVRRTADGVLVVHHDATVAGLGAIAHLMASDLPPWLPTLGAALDVCQGMDVNPEIKHSPSEPGYDETETIAIEVARLLERRDDAGRMVVSSFSLATIDAVRAHSADLETAWVVRPGADVTAAIAVAVSRGHGGIHPHYLFVDATMVETAHSAGLAVRVWTVDDPEHVVELAEIGVAAVITNDVARSLAAIGQGQKAPEPADRAAPRRTRPGGSHHRG